MMGHTQTGFTTNYPARAQRAGAGTSATSSPERHEGNHNVVEASAEAEQQWVDTIVSLARMNEKFLADVHARLLQQRR